ncbi:hypothetical protein K3495_g16187, partial [Podosphaera aphanis]
GRKRYYITFIDDFSRYAWISFLRNKNDAYQAIRDFVTRIQTQHNLTIKTFFSDNGGEYIDARVQKYFTDNGIHHEKSPPYEHESNGTAERFNRTIVTKARAMLLDLPIFLWAEAIATSVYLYNRIPHRTIDFRSPFELLHGASPPSITHLHAFGTMVYIHIPVETRPSGSKLQPRAIEGIFVGYTNSSNTFRIYVPSKRVVQITRQVTFPATKLGEVTIGFSQPAFPSNIPSSNDKAVPASSPIHTRSSSPVTTNVSENFAGTPLPSSPVSTDMPGNFTETPQSTLSAPDEMPGNFVDTPRLSRKRLPSTPIQSGNEALPPDAPKKP